MTDSSQDEALAALDADQSDERRYQLLALTMDEEASSGAATAQGDCTTGLKVMV